MSSLTSLVKRILAAMPGNTRRNRGRNFNSEARIHPALAWLMFLADNVLWTMTWSAHQYQMELKGHKLQEKVVVSNSSPDCHPCQYSCPGKISGPNIDGPEEVHELVLFDSSSSTGLHCPGDCVIVEGDILRLRHGDTIVVNQLLVTSDPLEAGDHQPDGADDHEDGLDKVSPDDSTQSSS